MTQFLTILLIVLVIVGVLYILWRPHWSFVVVIMLFPLEQLLSVYIPVFATKHWVFNVLVGFLALFAVMTRALRRDPLTSGYFNAVSILTWVLYGLWYVGYLWTLAPEEAHRRIVENTPYIGLLLVLTPLLIVDMQEFRRMVTGMIVMGTVLAVLIVLNPRSSFYGGRLTLDLGMVAGGVTNRSNPLALGELGGMVAVAAALLRPASINPLFTLVRVAAFGTGLYLSIGSGSRGQVLAAMVTGVIFFPISRRLANPKQFLITCIGLGALAGGIFMAFKLFIGYENRERWDLWPMLQDTMLRMDYVGELLSAWLASPANWLFGLGTQSFPAISKYQHADYVHNVAAEVLGQHGLVGFAIYSIIIYLLVRYAYRLFLIYRDDTVMRSAVAVLVAICFYGLLLSLKQGSMCFPAPFYWWMVLAKLSMHEQRMLATAGISLADLNPRTEQAEGDDLVDSELALQYHRSG